MKVIVAGGRYYSPTTKAMEWLEKTLLELKCTEEVCGEATGADNFGKMTAIKLGIPIKNFPADWNKFGASAGPIRNQQMAEYSNVCILFPGGSGTDSMRMWAERKNLTIIEYPYQDEA